MLSRQEKWIIEEKTYQFVIDNSIVKYLEKDDYFIRRDKQIFFKCPGCYYGAEDKYSTKSIKGYTVWEGYFSEFEAFNRLRSRFIIHLYATIRLNGDLKHIKLLIKILGKKLAIKKLEEFCEKNESIAKTIKIIIRELNGIKVKK